MQYPDLNGQMRNDLDHWVFLPEKTVVQFASHGNMSPGPVETKGNFCINFADLSVRIIRASLVCHISDLLVEYLLEWEGQDRRSLGTCQFYCDAVWGKAAKLDKNLLVENALSSGKIKNKYRGITANKNIMYFLCRKMYYTDAVLSKI